MNSGMLEKLANRALALLIAVLVWRYYRRRTFSLSERYSTFGPRFWAGCVDECVLWPVSLVATTFLSLDAPKLLAALLVSVESLAWLVYTVTMHARFGQTVGKMATRVRVVDFQTERSISWRQAWLREVVPVLLSVGFLGWDVFLILTGRVSPSALASGEAPTVNRTTWLLGALPLLWFVAEVVTMLTNKRRRALHDFIAGTVVVRTNTCDQRD